MNKQDKDIYNQFCEIFTELDNEIIKNVLLTIKKDDEWLDNVINKLSELQEGSEYHFCNAPIENKNESESKITDFKVSKTQQIKNKLENFLYKFNNKSIKYKKI